ncbi:hypothetical protein [Acetobacter thailandicus]|uniref:hypothetical protein n=1 Tax=Acetobacter thailandicus TaxID=1502842 RepID=UPI001BA90F68|nr:hypothetical protein [Acetobacter thailandicus]MBS1003671.1 hypothetical protein [Acetobacter thailandicus]
MGRHPDHQQPMITHRADLHNLEHRRTMTAGKTLSVSKYNLQTEIRLAAAKAQLTTWPISSGY